MIPLTLYNYITTFLTLLPVQAATTPRTSAAHTTYPRHTAATVCPSHLPVLLPHPVPLLPAGTRILPPAQLVASELSRHWHLAVPTPQPEPPVQSTSIDAIRTFHL